MMKRIYIYLFGAVLLTLVSSCSSTKSMKKSVSIGNLSETEYMTEVLNRAPAWDALTAKMSMAVDLNGKGATKVNGTIRMKRYVQVSFAELKGLAKADLDFHSLQALFLNEIFLPGKKTLSARDISAFTVHPENENAVLLEVKNGKKFAYRFRTTANEGLLKESHIRLAGTSYGLRWKYDEFRSLEKKQFPSRMLVSFEGGKKPVTATFDLSRLSTNSDWDTHTDVPKKYDKVELQDLLKQLIKK